MFPLQGGKSKAIYLVSYMPPASLTLFPKPTARLWVSMWVFLNLLGGYLTCQARLLQRVKQNKNYEYDLESETIAHYYRGHFMINKGESSLIFDNIFYDI